MFQLEIGNQLLMQPQINGILGFVFDETFISSPFPYKLKGCYESNSQQS